MQILLVHSFTFCSKLLLDLQAFAIMNNLVKLMQESFQMCHECDPTKAQCEVAMLPAMADGHGQVPWQKSLEIVCFFFVFLRRP